MSNPTRKEKSMPTITVPRIKGASMCIQYSCTDEYSYYIYDYTFNDHINVWCHEPDDEYPYEESFGTLDEAFQFVQDHIAERQGQ